jgi:8-oxo-dGTP pyrophosphatase MutT (NUDIX family)
MEDKILDISTIGTADRFCRQVAAKLKQKSNTWQMPEKKAVSGAYASAVLLLMGRKWLGTRFSKTPHLILNKRSQRVRQPGDLCCPGGGVELPWDSYFSRFIRLSVLPLWRYWPIDRTEASQTLALLMATGLRESFEEMGLNPLKVRFLGPLPPQRLIMFNRVIYPMVGWLESQKNFRLNWEVTSIMTIPITDLLKKQYYARYMLQMADSTGRVEGNPVKEFPCFCVQDSNGGERLWGATYRIVTALLQSVFNFNPPPNTALPQISGHLSQDYLTGSTRSYQHGHHENL